VGIPRVVRILGTERAKSKAAKHCKRGKERKRKIVSFHLGLEGEGGRAEKRLDCGRKQWTRPSSPGNDRVIQQFGEVEKANQKDFADAASHPVRVIVEEAT